jgi:long-chain acyl-CoA synthetase
MTWTLDLISDDQAGTLDGLFVERVARTPDLSAYRWHERDGDWKSRNWKEMGQEIARWRLALQGEGLAEGERVALLLRNCPEWVCFDQAALSLGLVDVPLYTDDRPDNIAYILEDSGARVLLVQDVGRWKRLKPSLADNTRLTRVLILHRRDDQGDDDPRVRFVEEWLPAEGGELTNRQGDPNALASIVYTSGTTGRPKGVMLSHRNMLSVAYDGLLYVPVYREDRFLSFLPLSHTLERTAGYYLPIMAGAETIYARSVNQLSQDLVETRPTCLISVPRVFERVHAKVLHKLSEGSPIARWLFKTGVELGWRKFLVDQGKAPYSPALLFQPLLDKLVGAKIRQRMGGEMRLAMSGGAPLSAEIARVFIGLGIPLLQGYGLTETAPVISVNPPEDNHPASVGKVLKRTEVKIGHEDELIVRGPGVMLGYWNNPQATNAIIDNEGWLHTGDQARISEDHIYITGRIKDILVLSNGEKVPPADMEMAICMDPLIDQALVIGEGRSYLTALLVLNEEQWLTFAQSQGVDGSNPDALHNEKITKYYHKHLQALLQDFPGFVKIRKVLLTLEPWTIDSGLLTPTMKLKRAQVAERYETDIERMYAED